MSGMTPAERTALGRIGAHISWANTTDRSQRTAAPRAAFEQRFLDAADGDPVRAKHLRTAYFQRLALKSAQARRRASEFNARADEADAELTALNDGDAALHPTVGGAA